MISFLKDIYKNKRLIANLAYADFKSRYAGSFLGIFWAFINPIVTVAVYWFVFDVGLKSGLTDGGYPFIVYLVTGIIVWFFFNDTIVNATTSFRDYSYLVKKVVFPIRVLPTIRLCANLIVHVFFIGLAEVLCAAYHYTPNLHFLQLLYYIPSLILFLTGLTWITSSIQPFFPDTLQFIVTILQMILWSTPILYSITLFSPLVQEILKFNPLYYIVTGYRNSFLGDGWIWDMPKQTVYFWVITIFLLWAGSKAYNNLKHHFADVL